jgi:hypothetical protein
VTVTLTITDQAPTTQPAVFTTLHGTPLLLGAGQGLLSFATDGDGDPLTVTLVSGPGHGTLALQPDGAFTYVPDPAFTGRV